MKKLYFAGAALLVLAGCAKTEVAAPESGAPETDWNAGEPVPVMMSAAPTINVVSKAVYDETTLVEGDSMSGLTVGIYGIETSADDTHNLIWNPAEDATHIGDLVNKSAEVADDGSISFEPAVYYPIVSDRTFSFFGYYPYSADAVSEQDACTVTYDLTQGNVDILWARSDARSLSSGGAGQYGYNAAYIRRLLAVNENHEWLPRLNFDHMLTALRFIAVPKEVGGAAVQITGFELYDVATQVALTVASTTPEDCGTVAEAANGTLTATGEADAPLAITPVQEGAPVATFTLLPGASYKARVTLSVDGVEQEPKEVEIVTDKTDATFKAGYIYNMELRISMPLEVTIISTTLDPWQEILDGGSIEI